MKWSRTRPTVTCMSVSVAVVALALASVLVLGNVNQSRPGASTSTSSGASTITGCSTAFAEPRIVLSLTLLYGSVYCAVFNGTAYYADYILPDTTFQSNGSGLFANGSILFRGVTFALHAWDNGQGLKVNMTFADGSSQTVEALYGSYVYAVALKHVNPAAGVLIKGVDTCPPPVVQGSTSDCPPIQDYLLASTQP